MILIVNYQLCVFCYFKKNLRKEISYDNEKKGQYTKIVRGPMAFFIQQLVDDQKGLNLFHPFRNVGTLDFEQGYSDLFTFFLSEIAKNNKKFEEFFFQELQDEEMIKKLFE